MHATTVKNKITQRDNYKEIMSVIVVVLLLTLTLIAIFSAIDQLGISEMGVVFLILAPWLVSVIYIKFRWINYLGRIKISCNIMRPSANKRSVTKSISKLHTF